VYPSNPADAKGLLTTSVLDPNPVIFFEHKMLYRSISGMVPEGYYNLPLGKATVAKEGEELTIVTYGWGVHWALETANAMPDRSIEVMDLRTLIPWDREAVFASVKKCGKVIVLHEDTITLGMGAEIASVIAEECFQYLDGPVKRVGSLDTPVPFTKNLEVNFLPNLRLRTAVEELLAY
jgi:2-oxoisovalerate dehydrogenase E1 component